MLCSCRRAGTKAARIVLLVVLLALFVIPPAAVTAQGPNLLQNPGFEAPFAASIPGKENCLIATPWVAWYVQGSEYDTSRGYRLAPEYKMATRADYPLNGRVRNGDLSQQFFHSFGSFEAGVYQVVQNVTPGATYKLEMWIQTWSCSDESTGLCSGNTSGGPSPMHVRIGLDPTGGTDPFNPAIVWSPEQNAYDNWYLFSVEAAAQNRTVTVFVYSHPDYPSQDNNVYLDDASLVLMGPPPTATPRPTNPPTVTPPATATVRPTAVPPATATVAPTAAPPPTNTAAPTAAPLPTTAPSVAPQPTSAPKPTSAPLPTATPVPPSLLEQLTSGPGLLVPLIGLALIVGVSIGVVVVRRRRY